MPRRFDESLFQNITPTIRALRRVLQNVIRHAMIRAGDAVEDVIERNLNTVGIAVLARVDLLFGLMQRSRIHQNDVLFLRCWIEEVTRHGADFISEAASDSRPRPRCHCDDFDPRSLTVTVSCISWQAPLHKAGNRGAPEILAKGSIPGADWREGPRTTGWCMGFWYRKSRQRAVGLYTSLCKFLLVIFYMEALCPATGFRPTSFRRKTFRKPRLLGRWP